MLQNVGMTLRTKIHSTLSRRCTNSGYQYCYSRASAQEYLHIIKERSLVRLVVGLKLKETSDARRIARYVYHSTLFNLNTICCISISLLSTRVRFTVYMHLFITPLGFVWRFVFQHCLHKFLLQKNSNDINPYVLQKQVQLHY